MSQAKVTRQRRNPEPVRSPFEKPYFPVGTELIRARAD